MSSVTFAQSLKQVHNILTARLSGKKTRLYEAGGGSASFMQQGVLKNAHVTVVDIDPVQIQNNTYADNKFLGDIQTHKFPSDSFDLIVCYNVIEHLPAPDQAITRFYDALGPGGLLFIAAPNPSSFPGFVTKLSPHWFHVLYYKYVLGYKDAGKPGSVPFKTIFHPIVTPSRLKEFCTKLGFNVVYCAEYRSMQYENLANNKPFLGSLLKMAIQISNALTLWRKDLGNGDYHIILEKPIVSNIR